MADDFEAFGVLVGDDRQLRIVLNAERGVDQMTIDFSGKGGFSQAGTNTLSNFGNGDRLRKFSL